jgi:uncharacterized repeat protein (TIGR03803 family)
MRHATLSLFRLIVVICLLAAIQSRAASQYALLHAFADMPTDGAGPQYNSSLATDGTFFYGVTLNGGTVTNKGVIFKMSVNGSGYQLLHSFNGLTFIELLLGGHGNTNDGVNPSGTPLLIGSTLYGVTQQGGTNGLGTAYKINTDGSGFQLLHSFGVNTLAGDGDRPQCTLVTDGTNIYGMAVSGSGNFNGLGTIFCMDTNGGNYRTLHNFGVATDNGNSPQGSLTISGGTLYGMTQMGGSLNSGVIFAINTDGNGFHLLHTFTGVATDGALPYGSLIISNTTLYGMTSAGGANNVGAVFSVDTSGSGFQILHSFAIGNTWSPYGDLTFFNSALYGMTHIGGSNGLGLGVIFQLNPDGSNFQILHTFFFANPSNLTDGSTPFSSLAPFGSQLYGMTFFGGSSHNAGAIFSFNPAGTGGGGGGPVTALRVTIQPPTAVKAGAQWRVNGGALMNSGTLASNLTSGAHVVSYTDAAGFITPAPQIIDITANITNALTGTYGVADTTKPTLKVTAPTSKTVVTSNLFTAVGTASDNVGLALVYYQLNGGAWTAAASGNSFTNWTAPGLNLTPGPNVISFYAKDLSGNVSATNSVTFTYTVSVPVTVNINIPGAGSVSPNLNGQLFPIGGKALKLGAKATKGFAFVNWSGSTNTSSSKISFVVASNLVFTANFKDITRPTDVILVPTKGQVFSSGTASGRAMDNVGITAIYYRLNSGTWTAANSNDGTNWQTADLSTQLIAGANTISTYAVDAAGNASLTNTIAFSYVVQAGADWAPDSLNGLEALITPSGGTQGTIGFDQLTFSQTGAANDLNREAYDGGTYGYVKTDTNMAQLSLAFGVLPEYSNNIGPVGLVFTNHYLGYYSNAPSDFGGISLQVANAVIPTTLVGKTVTGVSGQNGHTTKIKFSSATAFSLTSNSGSRSGTYTLTRLSPISGLVTFTFTSSGAVGESSYLQLTFLTATSGTYFVMSFDNLGVLEDIDTGTFLL